ncbi:MAG: SGNH/GDSL hydrolase family protein [Candidatus Eremiobacteraeota bacterium]|nr:SGNH/GDSL hydrolase family protein [Candidatus Eremiobacteraeota bacterium]
MPENKGNKESRIIDKKALKEEEQKSFFKRHPILTAFLKALAFLVVLFVIGEVMVRHMEVKSRAVPKHEGGIEFRPDPEIFWKLRTHLKMLIKMPKGGEFLVETNSKGIRNPEIPLKKPSNGYRIECYGDSITYGHGVDSEDTYEMQTQKILREKYGDKKNIDVINFGCPGYTAHQGWRLFKRIGVKYEPDLCIIGFNYADPSAEEMKDSERVPGNPYILTMMKFFYQSDFYLLLRQQKITIDRQGKMPDYYLKAVRVSEEEYRKYMEGWAAQMKKRNGHVIYLSLAMSSPDPFEYYANYRKICKDVAKKTGNYYIDMNTVFQQSGEDLNSLFLLSVAENENIDRIHPNEAGFELMAKAIAELIEKENLIK